MNVTLTLDRGTIDVPWARREVMALLAEEPVSADPQTVALVVTELVTNAMVHGSAPVELRVAIREERLRIEVRDNGPAEVPTEPSPPELTQASGRGLLIVDSMVERWGVEPADTGKVVWVEFDGPVEDDTTRRGPTTRSAQDTDADEGPRGTSSESSQGTPSTRDRTP
jgi:anti-sigma regulatory factor (Ser/Thr protein kinase)